MINRTTAGAALAIWGALASGCQDEPIRHVTVLATNDIHGAVEPGAYADGTPVGGMSYFAGVVSAIREGVRRDHGDAGGVLLLDGGDQFQGTLLSNYSEGALVFSLMDEMGYDAVVPGNHAYDFGPAGWLDDQVTPGNPDKNPRGVLERLARDVSFPLLSTNTYLKTSLQDAEGRAVPVSGEKCVPLNEGVAVDWQRARRPKFLKPYTVKKVAGVRVAMIGIDNHGTPHSTTPANVSDLCFREEAQSYLEARAELEGKAEIFLMLIHQGNTTNEQNVSRIVSQIVEKGGTQALHAVVAGHTHWVNHDRVRGVPIVQSGANGEKFGRIDFVYDTRTKSLVEDATRFFAGVRLRHGECDRWSQSFCELNAESGELRYEGVVHRPDPKIAELVAGYRKELEPIASRVLGQVEKRLTRNRTSESSLADAITDEFRKATGAEVAIVNASGLRANVQPGPLTYETFFQVLPFANHGLTVGPMRVARLLSLLERSARTCGAYGALMQSGLRVTFRRNCDNATDGVDKQAKLLRVETLGGEVLLDAENNIVPREDRELVVATLDFLSAGGSGYVGFKGVPVIQDFGILREFLTERFLDEPVLWKGGIDHRWKEIQN